MAAQRAGFASPRPVGFGSAILEVVDAEKAPLRVFFGEQPLHIASYTYQQRLDEWTAWAPVSRDAEGREDGAPGHDPRARHEDHGLDSALVEVPEGPRSRSQAMPAARARRSSSWPNHASGSSNTPVS
jgi:hypothetical protein